MSEKIYVCLLAYFLRPSANTTKKRHYAYFATGSARREASSVDCVSASTSWRT